MNDSSNLTRFLQSCKKAEGKGKGGTMQDKTPAAEFQLTPGAHCATEHRLWNIAVGND